MICKPVSIMNLVIASTLTGSVALGQECGTEVHATKLDEDDSFGCSVALDGKTMVVGAFNYGPGGGSTGDGVAFVFELVDSEWVQVAHLTASDLGDDDEFGGRVAIWNDTIVVGASQHAGMGAAYVFQKPADGWTDMTETAKLATPEGSVSFGSAVAIDGSTIAVGDQLANGSSGAVHVFQQLGQFWTGAEDSVRLAASDESPGQRLGTSVVLEGNVIVAGADHEGSDDIGSAYVFVRSGASWTSGTEDAKLEPSDGDPGRFGYSVDVRGNLIVAAAWRAPGGGTDRGAVYIFERPVGGWQSATETQKVIASDAVDYDMLLSVAILDDQMFFAGTHAQRFTALTSGAVYRFERGNSGWGETRVFRSTDGEVGDQFGTAIDANGDMLVAGANRDSTLAPGGGAAYVFDAVGGYGIRSDVNGDGIVDMGDLLIILATWGGC